MITVRAFAQVREVTGEDTFTLSLSTPTATVSEIKELLSQRSALWREVLESGVLCAVEQAVSDDNTLVSDGTEVAFFPPVTGG
ncbi:MoaD/ThiS family protein [Aestuariibacter sp. A3R04]|uniref:MoaD/ThiS family protein n=1 Tax=Aestuariibacter sp. A3R04 TaxID=2841571 RepID=UPI001C0912A9|nr:MoaD/ThiS family protein [Aestuariibacter sp. A3R04]MBU3023192.1 MoaD/ThiS family protein [Aestuariibacter sp. A3R04]